MKIQATVYYPIVVGLNVDLNDIYSTREAILAAADHTLQTTGIRPRIENVAALPEHRSSYVDITKLFEDES